MITFTTIATVAGIVAFYMLIQWSDNFVYRDDLTREIHKNTELQKRITQLEAEVENLKQQNPF